MSTVSVILCLSCVLCSKRDSVQAMQALPEGPVRSFRPEHERQPQVASHRKTFLRDRYSSPKPYAHSIRTARTVCKLVSEVLADERCISLYPFFDIVKNLPP
ncbi:uncharacterized protein LOC111271952 isoform X2 [Varroa jacobsoni]|uniref:uncharacterized protein LOC111271952 isoform X2 n=1 Tax=Varroa jacobsoni TaxID=62625 RepID=UPI000BF65626|nr:uncharacterized protein LOC111271952 isoform X2 [Varroa jacobsoni]